MYTVCPEVGGYFHTPSFADVGAPFHVIFKHMIGTFIWCKTVFPIHIMLFVKIENIWDLIWHECATYNLTVFSIHNYIWSQMSTMPSNSMFQMGSTYLHQIKGQDVHYLESEYIMDCCPHTWEEGGIKISTNLRTHCSYYFWTGFVS